MFILYQIKSKSMKFEKIKSINGSLRTIEAFQQYSICNIDYAK